jgi:DNA-binding transcriptional regulator LsrR (DeoR family)
MVRWLGDTQDDALDRVLLVMVAAHAGGVPCPTQREISTWTGISRRRAWRYLHGMQDRGLIEIEIEAAVRTRDGTRGQRRRVRLPNGEWTGWTNRTAGRR